MLGPFQKAIEMLDPLPVEEGPDKVMPLPAAIEKLVRPGMTLHLCTGHSRPGAAVIELVRAFAGKDPGFTLSCIGFVSTGVLVVHAGLTSHLISTFTGDSYPTPGPNAVITRAWKAGKLKIENWSILSFTLRLLAGAMGVPYLPTRSLLGSTLAEENREHFTVIEKDGEEFGLVHALRPDLAFIHAAAADKSGNALLTPPYGEEALGAWAAKSGAIVTAEKIVSTDFIRRYSYLCKIPSYLVAAVCPAPLGAHPGGVSNQGLPEIESYADDYDFILDFRKASKTEEGTAAWMKTWITDSPTWEHYLARLGRDRIWALKGKAHPDSWKSELMSLAPELSSGPEYSPVEMMVVAASRVLARRMTQKNLVTILAGVGTSNLAAWLGYYHLKEKGYHTDLMAEIGFYGYDPRPADPFIFNYRNIPTCKMLTGIPTIMGVFMGGAQNRCLGVIGAGQVDKFGNVNSTVIPGLTYLTGSGGGNDICSAAQEVLVTALSGRDRFLPQVAYITSPGKNVRAVVSDQGIFEKPEGEEELILTGYFPIPGKSEAEIISEIKENCGWPLKVSSQVAAIDPPSLSELKLLRIFDPRRQFLGKR